MRNEGLGSWPERRSRISPDRPALVFQGRKTTFGELAERTTKLANQLRATGIEPGDRVAYLGPNHPAFVETMFATHLLGGVFVPLNYRLAAPEIDYMLGDCAATLLIHGPECADAVRELTGIKTVALATEYESWLSQGDSTRLDIPVSQDDVALILYTSGTTGHPKGAMLTHANQIWNTYNVLIAVDVTSNEVTLVTAPLFHVAALGMSLLPTFAKGGCSVLTPTWDVDMCYDLIEKHQVTWMFGVTTMYAGLASSPRWATADLSSLRSLMTGGAPVPKSLIGAYQERGLVFCQGYGLTETSPGATFLEAADSVRKAGSAGVPMFFEDVRVSRPDLTETDVREPGEVLIKGPNVMLGYWENPAATGAAFTDGWLHSGDVAWRDDDGYVYIVDRVKDMFISGGENVYPAQVENAIAEHPAVAEVAVVGVADEKWGEVGRAFVVCQPDTHLTGQQLRDFLLGRLAKYKIPVHVDVLAELPHTASGKVRKGDLRKLPLTGQADR